ncbi:SDR family oxidoreductase [Streptomyces sp. NBC_01601]|uniref:SDR family oxidoreductase n=1 Tax=Streptomyces sp. NBC_01601 TaxID=2975892 RepID=UPI002E2DD26C|nr:SDR family oxidoreductase [Streptomyces sp. NBC_01601]
MTKRILITGGASGLGRALAQRYAAAGHRVLIADLSEPDELPPGEVSFMRLDVRVPDDWERARRWCETTWGGLDILVNNAGVAAAGRVERLQPDDWDWILDINLKGTVNGCRAFVPLFKRQGSGHVVNVASMAGLLNLPGMVSYNVSKAAVVSLSETLRQELAPYGVRTTVVCPGFVRTNLGAGMRSPDPVLAKLADRMIQGGKLTADQVAERVVAAVAGGRFLVLTHPEGRRAARLKRFLPRLVEGQIAKAWRRTAAKLDAQDRQEAGTV